VDTADAGFTAIQNCYFSNTGISLAVMDGPSRRSAARTLGDCAIIDFSREEPLEEAMSVKVTRSRRTRRTRHLEDRQRVIAVYSWSTFSTGLP